MAQRKITQTTTARQRPKPGPSPRRGATSRHRSGPSSHGTTRRRIAHERQPQRQAPQRRPQKRVAKSDEHRAVARRWWVIGAITLAVVSVVVLLEASFFEAKEAQISGISRTSEGAVLAALDLQTLRATGEALIEPDDAARIAEESIANGPLPDARLVAVSVDYGGGVPVLSVTLELEVDFVMAPALPNGLDSTTITRTKSVSILG